MQKQPSCKKEARPSKVESYLKDEQMHGIAVISECGKGLSTDSQYIDQALHCNLLYYNNLKNCH